MFYFDSRIDPVVTQSLQRAMDEKSLASNLSHETTIAEQTTDYRGKIDEMKRNDPEHVVSNESSVREDGPEPEGGSVNPN
ncbi:MAG: hypothetical protein Q8R24_02305 [Legionellaceae bacterium]|nr:hypothetical protein [Legionellaceae bacterium]